LEKNGRNPDHMSDHIQKKETGNQSGVMFEAGGSLPETEEYQPGIWPGIS